MKIFNILPDSQSGDNGITWFFMPDSTVIRSGNPFFIPDFDDRFEIYPALAIKVSRLGKSVAERFAYRYYNEITLAATVRATHLLDKLSNAGLPWTQAVNFDKSCFLGDFITTDELKESNDMIFRLGNEEMKFTLTNARRWIAEAIVAISADNIIKMGDIVLIPLTGNGIIIKQDQNLSASVNLSPLLEIRIK